MTSPAPRGLITDFGKIADPIADKAITGMALIGLSVVGDVWWWVTIVVLVARVERHAATALVLKNVVIAAAQSGKIKTTFQGVALGLLVLPLPHGDNAHGGEFDRFAPVGEWVFYAGQVFLVGAVVMTLWSGYEFFRDVWRQRASQSASPDERGLTHQSVRWTPELHRIVAIICRLLGTSVAGCRNSVGQALAVGPSRHSLEGSSCPRSHVGDPSSPASPPWA